MVYGNPTSKGQSLEQKTDFLENLLLARSRDALFNPVADLKQRHRAGWRAVAELVKRFGSSLNVNMAKRRIKNRELTLMDANECERIYIRVYSEVLGERHQQ